MDIVTSLTFSQVFSRLTFVPLLLAAAVGLLRWHRLSTTLRCLAGLVWFELPIEIASLIIGLRSGSNLFLMPIYTVGEFALLTLVYRQALQSASFNKIAPWLVGGFTAYALFDSLRTPTALVWFQPGQQVIQSLLILGLVALHFRKLLNELRDVKLSSEPIFWVSIGLSAYFLGYIQIALFSNYLMKHYSTELNEKVWTVEYALSYLLHFCYAWALWMRPQK